METVYKFDEGLKGFQNIVLFYKDKDDDSYIGTSSFYGGSDPNKQTLSILYKDPLPNDRDAIMGWNYLDDHSPYIYLVYTDVMETAVDDFMAAHQIDKTWKDIDYNVIENYTEIDDILNENPLNKNEVRAYAILKHN
ncbi:MAG: hypothetical protein IKE51_01990 [Solobacterium sp.]|nr:hypothetical protein [Solobacterium sp.]